MSFAAKAVTDLLPILTKLLPVKAPGISVMEAHAAIGKTVADSTVRTALVVLERDGIAVSYKGSCQSNCNFVRLFHRGNIDDPDAFEDANLVYGDADA
jgi:hypothetical protein